MFLLETPERPFNIRLLVPASPRAPGALPTACSERMLKQEAAPFNSPAAVVADSDAQRRADAGRRPLPPCPPASRWTATARWTSCCCWSVCELHASRCCRAMVCCGSSTSLTASPMAAWHCMAGAPRHHRRTQLRAGGDAVVLYRPKDKRGARHAARPAGRDGVPRASTRRPWRAATTGAATLRALLKKATASPVPPRLYRCLRRRASPAWAGRRRADLPFVASPTHSAARRVALAQPYAFTTLPLLKSKSLGRPLTPPSTTSCWSCWTWRLTPSGDAVAGPVVAAGGGLCRWPCPAPAGQPDRGAVTGGRPGSTTRASGWPTSVARRHARQGGRERQHPGDGDAVRPSHAYAAHLLERGGRQSGRCAGPTCVLQTHLGCRRAVT